MKIKLLLLTTLTIPLLYSSAYAKGARTGKEKRIVREESYKTKSTGDKTAIDFDSVDIGGERKTPVGSLVDSAKNNNDYDFIKIRMKWHPEMIQSASSLDKENN